MIPVALWNEFSMAEFFKDDPEEASIWTRLALSSLPKGT
jgi:hypothetical protein